MDSNRIEYSSHSPGGTYIIPLLEPQGICTMIWFRLILLTDLRNWLTGVGGGVMWGGVTDPVRLKLLPYKSLWKKRLIEFNFRLEHFFIEIFHWQHKGVVAISRQRSKQDPTRPWLTGREEGVRGKAKTPGGNHHNLGWGVMPGPLKPRFS